MLYLLRVIRCMVAEPLVGASVGYIRDKDIALGEPYGVLLRGCCSPYVLFELYWLCGCCWAFLLELCAVGGRCCAGSGGVALGVPRALLRAGRGLQAAWWTAS